MTGNRNVAPKVNVFFGKNSGGALASVTTFKVILQGDYTSEQTLLDDTIADVLFAIITTKSHYHPDSNFPVLIEEHGKISVGGILKLIIMLRERQFKIIGSTDRRLCPEWFSVVDGRIFRASRKNNLLVNFKVDEVHVEGCIDVSVGKAFYDSVRAHSAGARIVVEPGYFAFFANVPLPCDTLNPEQGADEIYCNHKEDPIASIQTDEM